MHLMFRGDIDFREYVFALETALSPFNIRLGSRLREERRGLYELDIRVSLVKPIPYVEHLSRHYDRARVEQLKRAGVVVKPVLSHRPHFYHYAITYDAVAFTMSVLSSYGLVDYWVLSTEVADLVDSIEWRQRVSYSYRPDLDPAFNRGGRLADRDPAGFPRRLAEHLVDRPFIPPALLSRDLPERVASERRGIGLTP